MLTPLACISSSSLDLFVRINIFFFPIKDFRRTYSNFCSNDSCFLSRFFFCISFSFHILSNVPGVQYDSSINKSMFYCLFAIDIDIVSLHDENDTNEVFSFPFAFCKRRTKCLNGTKRKKKKIQKIFFFLCVRSDVGSHCCRHRHCRYTYINSRKTI